MPPRRATLGVLAAVVIIATMAALAGRTGDGTYAGGALLWTLLATAPLALAWLGAGVGCGVVIARGLLGDDDETQRAAAPALGVAVLLVIDAALGRLGLLFAIPPFTAWAILLPGWIALILHVRRRGAHILLPPAWLLPAAPAVAVLLVAACTAPGWLWASEFGGYDALSYHLQCPREWIAAGRIHGLEHNVYSFLPGYGEAAFAHVLVLGGGAIDAVIACQLLHAGIALLAASATAHVGRRLGGEVGGMLGAVIVLGTPWVIVTGSLAYSEMAVTLFLASGLAVLLPSLPKGGAGGGLSGLVAARAQAIKQGAALGLLAGAACGAKLPAIGMVAAPLALLVVLRPQPVRALIAMVVAGALMLVPYFTGNLLETGNPVFPFATDLFGTGHWTVEQAEIWRNGHRVDADALTRLRLGFDEWLRYGIGPPPDASEPWAPQWSILPWLGLLAGAVGLMTRAQRDVTRLLLVLLVQLVFWLALTHVKSRFMTPSVVPAALLVVAAAAGLGSASASRRVTVTVGTAAFLYALLPMRLHGSERAGAPAAAIGAVPLKSAPAVWINHDLPQGARVLLVGEAAPLYMDLDRITYHTTWDRGPMSRIAGHADESVVLEALADEGYTHVLIDPVMLHIWGEAGWRDPALDPRRLIAAADAHAELVARTPAGVSLYRFP